VRGAAVWSTCSFFATLPVLPFILLVLYMFRVRTLRIVLDACYFSRIIYLVSAVHGYTAF